MKLIRFLPGKLRRLALDRSRPSSESPLFFSPFGSCHVPCWCPKKCFDPNGLETGCAKMVSDPFDEAVSLQIFQVKSVIRLRMFES